MKPEYSPQQIIFALNSIANAPSGRHGSVDELQAYAQTLIKQLFNDPDVTKLIGQWSLVWGTQVFQAPGSTVADNAMYIAQNMTNKNEFVVAISGTNPISAYGWIIEDAKLIPTVPWPYSAGASQPTGNISSGTNTGLNVLLNTLTDDDLSLSEFLADQVSKSDTPLAITVTGHSLGGALSPAVALALLDTKVATPSWDPKNTAKIFVQPSAGPTPGDDTWRNYYDDRLKDATDRLWNNIDMVPHAWQLSMLEQIPSLYVPSIPQNYLIEKLVNLAELNSKLAGNMQQICPQTIGLPGTVNTSIDITIKELLEILETLVANGIIDRLGIPKDLEDLIKTLIDDWIKHLNSKDDATQSVHKTSIWSDLKTAGEKALDSHWSGFESFIDFLKQAAYQHTTAYSILLGTVSFDDIVTATKERIN